MAPSITQSTLKPQSRRVALVGTPNVGKSVLFNALTGRYVTVSNYPGTSVEVSRGNAVIDGTTWEVVDTPGMYAVHTITEEERVAREILLHERPDLVLHVLDARNLERMLAMTVQLIEAGLPVVLVVNIMDEAERLGLSFDFATLEKRLGIPVIPAATARKRGLDAIRQAIASSTARCALPIAYGRGLEQDIAQVTSLMHGEYVLSLRTLALLMLQGDSEIESLVVQTEGETQAEVIRTQIKAISFRRRESLHLDLSLERKEIVTGLLQGVVHEPAVATLTWGSRISHLAVHPVWGTVMLAMTLYYGLYVFVGGFGAGTLVDLLEKKLFEQYFNPWITTQVHSIFPWWWLQELLVGEYGVITLGLRYAVGIILPIVTTFFLFFSFLEDAGYLPRLALLVDRIFKWFGLSGRAVIPMVLGFGCSTMATMVTRTLETVRERIIATILLALAIPCSAQLGVIIGLLGKTPGALVVWMLSISFLMGVVGILAGRLMPGEAPMFYMELPPMRAPQLSNVLTKTYTRMLWYFLEILPLFVMASVLMWLGKITHTFEKLVSLMTPVMHAIGLPQEAAVAFIFGFFRRDYGAAGLYDLQTKGVLDGRQLTVAAVTLTLFIPCVAQFLMMYKERGFKVSISIFIGVSLVAFASGYLLNQLLLVTGLV
ncbi:MAG: ferrous iron transport protein B [Trichlorobacter sp.]